MPLPLDPTEPASGGSPANGDDELRALKTWALAILGAPSAPSAVGNAGFTFDTAGLTKAIFQHFGAPAAIGEMTRNGTVYQVHNGEVQTLGYRSDNFIVVDAATSSNVTLTTEQSFHSIGIPANTIGTTGAIQGTADIFIESMLNGATLTILVYWGGGNVLTTVLTNGAGSTGGDFGVHLEFGVRARNTSVDQWAFATATVGHAHAGMVFTNGEHTHGAGVLANVDVAAATTFQINGFWSAVDASNVAVGMGALAYRVAF